MDKKAGSGLDARESGSRVSGLLILLSVCMLFCAVLSLPGCSDPGASTDEDGGSARASQEGKETDQTEPSTEIDLDSMDFEYLERDKDASYDVKTATSIIFDGESAQVKGGGGSCGRLDRHHFRRGVLRGVWNDGEAQIASCNEGLEAEQVYVNGGDIRVKADDDGLNASAREVTATGEQAAADQTEGGWGLEGAMRKGM